MARAYRVNTYCVPAKDKEGRTHHYYHPETGLSCVIPWLSDEQAEYFLSEGLVTAIDIQSEDETRDVLDRVSECVKVLGATDLPADCGAPKARETLRDNGHKFSNDVIAAAVKARKAALSGTASG